MNRPVHTTIIFALISGLLMIPGVWLLERLFPWSLAFKLALWADLSIYALLLARWSRTALTRIIFPLAILLGVAIWPQTHMGYYFLAMGMLGWIRSGTCYQSTPVRAFMAEVLCIVGAAVLLVLLGGSATFGWALNTTLFFLVQSLYFFIIPGKSSGHRAKETFDPFDRALADAARVLEEDGSI